jgi:hypothetical protein
MGKGVLYLLVHFFHSCLQLASRQRDRHLFHRGVKFGFLK